MLAAVIYTILVKVIKRLQGAGLLDVLKTIKDTLCDSIKAVADSGRLPHGESMKFIDGGNVVSVWFEIIQNALVDVMDVDVFIEGLPVESSGKNGYVEISFPIPLNQDCRIDRVSVENWSQELDSVESELEKDLIRRWND